MEKKSLLPFYTSKLRVLQHFGEEIGGLIHTEAMSAMDINAERERIRKEIEALEKSLDPKVASIEVVMSDSNLDSDSESDDLNDDSDVYLPTDGERGEGKSDDETDRNLPESPETCLQMNLVYQEVIQEKIQEVVLLLAQNKEQQEDILWKLAGPRTAKTQEGVSLKANVFVGHFLKPYFKDKATGCGPPANEETREKAAQGVKSFRELNIVKWKTEEKVLLKNAVLSDRLQHMLQPKLFKQEYLNQKLENAKDDANQKILEKQILETEKEIEEINQLSEKQLVGKRSDEHDWEKISNINFEGTRSACELRKFWQNSEHPSISKREWSEQEVEDLKEAAAKHNYVNWQLVAEELGTNRTAFQCLQKYQGYNNNFKKREWTTTEDQILVQLVEEMRVGSHIPYQKIAYYMEGRDTMQLIYRWTKSVDPCLKKGFWTSEEDAKLLRAVSKYGERDWYKIRSEVPGRSDSQCRERYREALNFNVKKGKWSEAEVVKFLELIDKYGVGHWTKIASELPHRTDSQCLSKWKSILGVKKKPGQRQKTSVKWSSSSSEIDSSSDSSEESETMELDSSGEEKMPSKVTRPAVFNVPAIDLWIPTRDKSVAVRKRMFAQRISTCPGSSFRKSKDSAADALPPANENSGFPPHACEGSRPVRDEASNRNTVLKGINFPHVTDINTEDPAELLKEASGSGKHILRVTFEAVKKVLRSNTYIRRQKLKEKMKKHNFPKSSVMSQISSDMSVDQVMDVLQSAQKKRDWRNSIGLQNSIIDRKLLLAVSPWVGNVLVPYSARPGSMLQSGTKADSINEQLQRIHFPSTPVFTLLIQLFQIDADGCLQVIRERKTNQLNLLRAMSGKPRNLTQQSDSLHNFSGSAVQCYQQRSFPAPLGTVPDGSNAIPAIQQPRGSMAAVGNRKPGSACLRSPRIPRQKLKTVSELLREKRMRESNASSIKTSSENAGTIAPTILVPQSLITKQPEQGSGEPQIQSPQNPSLLTQSTQVPLLSLPPLSASPVSFTPLNLTATACVPAAGSCSFQGTSMDNIAVHEKGERSLSCGSTVVSHTDSTSMSGTNAQTLAGDSLTSSTLQNEASAPNQVPNTLSADVMFSQTTEKGGPEPSQSIASIPAVATSVPVFSPRQNPLSFLPTAVPPQGGPQGIANKLMPYTWVVTPQGFVPMPIQMLLGLSGYTEQAALSETGLNAPTNRLPLAGLSNVGIVTRRVLTVADRANTAVLSNPAVHSSQVDESMLPVSKSVNENSMQLKRSSVIMPSTSTNTGGQLSKALPVLSTSSGCPQTNTSFDSEELSVASPTTSSGPSSRATSTSTSVPSAELLCSLSLISLSKGGTTVSEESSSCLSETQKRLQRKRPLQQALPDTVVKASTHRLASVAKTVPITPRPEGMQCPMNPPKPPVSSSEKSPTRPPLTSSDKNPNQPPVSNRENKILDLSLVSLEEEANVRGWLKGERGVKVPLLKNGLPYLPPSACNLKTLSRLLQQKHVLEQRVVSLLPSSGENQEANPSEQLHVIQDLVAQKLKDNPAYLLLKARFLSAFTLPAFLATLAPPRVRTTMRPGLFTYKESDDEESGEAEDDFDERDLTDNEIKEGEHREGDLANHLTGMPLDNATESLPAVQSGALSNQDLSVEPCSLVGPDDSVVVEETTTRPTRRSSRLRKRI